MRLRPKKAINLSQLPIHSTEKHQIRRNLNSETQAKQTKTGLTLGKETACEMGENQKLATVLVNFINNINYAKKESLKPHSRPVSSTQSKVLKKPDRSNQKYSEVSESIEQKKADYRYLFREEAQKHKRSRKLTEYHIDDRAVQRDYQSDEPGVVSENIQKNMSEFNITNNRQPNQQHALPNLKGSWDLNQPCFFVNNPIDPSWLGMDTFFRSNLDNCPSLSEETRNGLYRQFQMYEMFKNEFPQQHSYRRQPFKQKPDSPVNNAQFSQKDNSPRVQSKNVEMKTGKSKTSPEKVIKRASYHVGIAYNIYMDKLSGDGKSITNFQDIDPTRAARLLKKNCPQPDFSKFSQN